MLGRERGGDKGGEGGVRGPLGSAGVRRGGIRKGTRGKVGLGECLGERGWGKGGKGGVRWALGSAGVRGGG